MKTAHGQLVVRAERWLRGTVGCSVVTTRAFVMTNEKPDAIGWKASGASWLVECKTTRSDFFRDFEKPWRKRSDLGMGRKRFYLVPSGWTIIKDVSELPLGWGLLHLRGQSIVIVRDSDNFYERSVRQELVLALSINRHAAVREKVHVRSVATQSDAAVRPTESGGIGCDHPGCAGPGG